MAGGGGADSGQAASGGKGFFASIMDWKAPWSSGDPASLLSGGVVGSGPTIMAEETRSWTEQLQAGVSRRMAGGLPGYGDLWDIGSNGVQVTQAGKIVAAAAIVGAALLLMGGKRGRW